MEQNTSYRILTPFYIYITEERITVSFVQTQQLFNLKVPADPAQVKIIQDAINGDSPIQVYIDQDGSTILKVAICSTGELHVYKSSVVQIDDRYLLMEVPAMSQSDLDSICSQINNASCSKHNVDSCIPFQFATDGCYARAHKMREIIIKNGFDCEKYFIHGNLSASKNGAFCVQWGYHVAPLVRVKSDDGGVVPLILDPSLFDMPVTIQEWETKCISGPCNPNAFIQHSSRLPGIVYTYNPTQGTGMLDTLYRMTNCVLSKYRNLNGAGPAPYIPECWL